MDGISKDHMEPGSGGSTWEVEAGESLWIQGQYDLQSKSRTAKATWRNHVLKPEQEKEGLGI